MVDWSKGEVPTGPEPPKRGEGDAGERGVGGSCGSQCKLTMNKLA